VNGQCISTECFINVLLLVLRNAYETLVGKPGGKGQLRRYLRRCENNVRTDIREIGWEAVDWAQDRDQWRAFENTVMKVLVL